MAVRRYLRTWDDHYRNLTQLERALNITDANLKHIRRSVANFTSLDVKAKQKLIKSMKQLLHGKLPSTDLQRRFQQL